MSAEKIPFSKKELLDMLYEKNLYVPILENKTKKELYHILNFNRIERTSPRRSSPKKISSEKDLCLIQNRFDIIETVLGVGYDHESIKNMDKQKLCNLLSIESLLNFQDQKFVNINVKKYKFDLSEIFCSNLVEKKDKEQFCNFITDFMVSSMLRTISENLFDEPERCIAEIINNAIESYTVKPKISRFGIGFISLFYWLYHGRDKSIVIISKTEDEYWYATLHLNKTNRIILTLQVLDNIEGKTGTVISLINRNKFNFEVSDIKQEMRLIFDNQKSDSDDETEAKFVKYTKLFNFLEDYEFTINKEKVSYGKYSVSIDINGSNFIVEDQGRGISINTLITSLLIPKINSEKIKVKNQKSIMLFKHIREQKSSLTLGINRVGIVRFETDLNGYQYFLNFPSHYHIIRNEIIFKDDISDLIEDVLDTVYKYNHFDIVYDLLSQFSNKTTQIKVKNSINELIYKFQSKNTFGPIKSDVYPDGVLVSKHYSVSKLNKLLKEGLYNDKIFIGNNVFFTRGVDTFSREGTSNCLFIRDGYALKFPSWDQNILTSMPNEDLTPYKIRIKYSETIINFTNQFKKKIYKDKIKLHAQYIQQIFNVAQKKIKSFTFRLNGGTIDIQTLNQFIFSNICPFLFSEMLEDDINDYLSSYYHFWRQIYVVPNIDILIEPFQILKNYQYVNYTDEAYHTFLDINDRTFKRYQKIKSVNQFDFNYLSIDPQTDYLTAIMIAKYPKYNLNYDRNTLIDILVEDKIFLEDLLVKVEFDIKLDKKSKKSGGVLASDILHYVSNNDIDFSNIEWINNVKHSNFPINVIDIAVNANSSDIVESTLDALIKMCYSDQIEIEANSKYIQINSNKSIERIIDLLIPYMNDFFVIYRQPLCKSVSISYRGLFIECLPLLNSSGEVIDIKYFISNVNGSHLKIIVETGRDYSNQVYRYVNRTLTTLPIKLIFNQEMISVKRQFLGNVYLEEIHIAEIFCSVERDVYSNIQFKGLPGYKLEIEKNIIINFNSFFDRKKNKDLIEEVIEKAKLYYQIYTKPYTILSVDCTRNVMNEKDLDVIKLIDLIYQNTDCKKSSIKVYLEKYSLEPIVTNFIYQLFNTKKISKTNINKQNQSQVERILTYFIIKVWEIGNKLEREKKMIGTHFDIYPTIVINSYKEDRYLGYYDHENHKIILNANKLDFDQIVDVINETISSKKKNRYIELNKIFGDLEHMSPFIHELSHAWNLSRTKHEFHISNDNLIIDGMKIESDYYYQGHCVYNRICQENLFIDYINYLENKL